MTGGAVVDVLGGQTPQIPSERGDIALSLVIPTFNEADNIGALLRRLHEVLTGAGVTHELIVVDDDSPDRTWEVAAALADEVPTLRVLRRTGESGLATAVVCGWAHARSRVLGVIDGDGQHPPEVVLDLLAALDHGHIAGAALDVFNEEPLPADHPYWDHPKVLMTPHIAGQPHAGILTVQIVENIRRARDGEPLLNLVDPAVGF